MSIRASFNLLVLASSFAIGGCGADPVDTFIAKLHDPNVDTRRAAARSLAEYASHDQRAIAELEKSTSDKDSEVRYLSVDAIAQRGSAAKSSLPLLRLRLADTEKNVRLRAAFMIQKIDPNDRSFVPVITASLREGDGRTLLDVAAIGPGAAWATPTLSGLLSHESPKVRTLAARALGSIGPAASAAKPALEAAQNDPNDGAKKAASDALKRIQSQ